MVRRNASPLSGLSEAEIKRLAVQLRAALKDVFADSGAVQPVHPPLTARHAHEHADYAGGSHSHVHEHDGDADHDHEHAAQAAAGKPYKRHVRFEHGEARELAAEPYRIYNAAGAGDVWDELAATVREFETWKRSR